MSQSIQTTSLSKEMSSEESYSKTSISSSTTMMSSQESSIKSSAIMDSSALASQLESDLSLKELTEGSITGSKMATLEKSLSVAESESSISIKKAETSSAIEESSTSTSISMKKEQSIKMSSEEISKSATYQAISSEGSIEKDLPEYVVLMDYNPRDGDFEGVRAKEGEEVVIIDSSKAHKWRVRLKKSGLEGTVPSCYLEQKGTPTPPIPLQMDTKSQAALVRREKVLKELVDSEEAFARDMQYVVNNYIKEMESKQMPKDLRDHKDTIFTNFKAISEFHNNVLMKGLQYYVNEPARIGKTFLRLERDFDMHVSYCRDEPEAQQLLVSGDLKNYFDNFSQKLQDEKTLSEHLKLPIQRINDYQLLLKELIKYTARLKEDTMDLEKAHDFMQAIPQRIADLQYLNSIQGYKGNLHKLGRILKHDWFDVIDCNNIKKERFLFLFKGRIFATDHKRVGINRSFFIVKNIIKFADVEIVDNADDDDLKLRFQALKKGQSGYPITIKASSAVQKEEWLNTIQVTAMPQAIEDLADEEPEPLPEEVAKKPEEEASVERNGRVEILEDFEAYEEMHTVITESVRSGSMTSLDDFHSALEDEPSLCFTTSEAEAGGPGRPKFIKPLRARSCAEGAEAILECEICSTPDATVAWLKDNAPLQATLKAIIESDGGKHRLILKKTEASDSGLYTIIASNVNGTVSCSVPLAVHSAPDMLPPTSPGGTPINFGPLFQEKLKNIELQEGTAFRVCVIVQGQPTPEIKFYKEDEEIKSEGRVRIAKESKECYELVIDSVQIKDKGKYSCVATSSCGQNVTSCNLTVSKQRPVFKTPRDELEKSISPEEIESDRPWPKDRASPFGKEVEAGEKFKVEIDESKDTLSLVFQHVTPGDTGMYTRVASTGSGKISCSAELTVQGGLPREPEAAKASSTSKDVVVKEGESALLELTATGYPKPRVTWTKDGKELTPGDKYAVLQEDDESFTMAIKNVVPDDSGKYSALAKNELGESSVDYKLQVTSPPKFVKPMKDSSVSLNEDITFEVEVQGSPEPTVTWCKDGQQLAKSDRIKIEKDGPICKLTIKNAKLEDVGNYSCTAKNSEGQQASFGALQTKAPLKFVQGLKDTSVNLSQDAVLKVKISGSPTPNIKWSKDNSELKVDGSRIIQKEESAGSYTLTIKKTTKNDAGNYSCEISNVQGKDKTSGKLLIREKPTFEKLLEDKVVTEGDKNVKLSVKVSGTPMPKLKWFIKDVEITETSNYSVISIEESGSSSLTIKEVTKEIEGTYKCEASNEFSTIETTSKVTVQEGKAKSTPPKFEKDLNDLQIKEGADAEFKVKATGLPKPQIKWSKDDAELSIDGKHTEFKTEEAEDSYTLIIKTATKDDTGKYTCTITNTEGSESSSSKLTVTTEEKSAFFEEVLKDKTIKEGETVEYSVKYDGKPKPASEWKKDDNKLAIDGKHIEQKVDEVEQALTLIIHDATKEDSGKYTCTVKNTAGSQTTSSKLKVEEKTVGAKIVSGLKDISVTEGENTEFTVKISGAPKPTAKWTKDGADLTIDGKHFQYKKEEADDSLTIVLNKATKEDAGKYVCTISNDGGSDTSSSDLKVTETTEGAKFVTGLKDQIIKEEENVEFTIKFSGKPKPSAKWTKDGAELTIDNKKFEYKKEEAEDSLTVVLKKASKEDAGKYSCTISNSAGSDTSSCEIKVTEKTVGAKIVSGLKDISVTEGENTEFTVKISGAPKPTAKWTKDGAELTIDNKKFEYKKEEAEDSLTIVLKKASKEDAGKYSCTISNSDGSDTSSCEIKVTESTEVAKFVTGLKDQSIKEEENVEFTVKFSGKPKPSAKWAKDGAELTINGKKFEYKKEEAEDSLTIILKNASKEDAGKYSCSISNAAGSDTSSCELKISEKTESAKFTKSLKDQTVKEEEKVEFSVKFSGKPMPSAKWTKDGAELTIDGKRFEYKKEEAEDSLTLVLKKASKEDAGTYTCTISNSAGSESSDSKLKVDDAETVPKFTQGLKDQSAKEEQTIKFNVKIEGKPKPTVKWNKDDAELTIDGKRIQYKVEEAENSLTLILNNVSKDDAGKYSCVISNSLGSDTTSSKMTVTESAFAPDFTEGLKDQGIKIGETIQLKVKFNGKPKPTAKWTLDGTELIIDGKRIQLQSEDADTSLTLIINSAIAEDAGKYSCTVTNSCGSKSSSAKLSITAHPVITKQLQDTEAEMNGTTRLNVKFEGQPEPSVTWKKDGVALALDGKHLKAAIEADDSTSLIINKIENEDAGSYTCEVKNPLGSASTSGKLTVSGKPVIKRPLEDQEILENVKEAELSLEVKATPAPEIKWLFNGKELTNDDTYALNADDSKGIYKLNIKKVTPEAAGEYKVEAKNSGGKAECAGKLTVLAKPSFVKDLKDIQILEGDELKLETSIKGFPEPTVTWLKGKKEAPSDEHCQKTDEGQNHTLLIKESTMEDAGSYTCKAKNNVGDASQTANVTIKSKKETQAPTFLTHLKDQTIVVADAGRMEVKLSGKPQPTATWYKNEDVIRESDVVLIKTDGQDYSLTLKDLTISDCATYTCKAVNEYGEAKESCVLTVKEPVAPKIEGLENVKVSFGAPARIKAKISGFPLPEVTWAKDGTTIKKNDECYQITEDAENNKHAVAIKNVKQNEVGEFTCTASNSAGKDQASCNLSITAQAPVITKELKDQTIDGGEPLSFQVEVHGYPMPAITWTKDGVSLENDPHFVSSQNKDMFTLKAEQAVPKDAGIYVCKATNDAGSESTKSNIKIKDFAPAILEKLPEKIKLIEGETMQIKAKFSGQPSPQIKWLKDGKPLKLSQRIRSEVLPDGTVQLTIDDVTHDDSGSYKLVATNDIGHASTECTADVEFKAKALKPFVQQLQPQNLVTGTPLKLEAKVTGNPKPAISWLKDGKLISESSSATRAKTSETPEGHAVLTIDHVTEEDTGEFTLKAANDLGEDTSSSQVTASAPSKKPTFSRELKPATFLEGESGKLEAIVSGKPQPTLDWTHNGKNIMEGQNCTLSFEPNGLASLTLPKVAKENGGKYTLTATNKSGKAITEAPVIVVPATKKEEEKKPKKLMEFNQGLMPALVPEGRPCKLEAKITTDPKPTSVKWCKDGKEVIPNERIEIINNAQTGEIKLCIKQMTADDRGKYSVIVSDGQNEMKNECLVNMIPAMPGMSGNKPYFIKNLEPVTLGDGETLKLKCQLAPECKCAIKWMKDGDDLVKGNRIHMVEQTDGTLGLTIENVTIMDGGKYVIIASNEEGKTRSSAIVAVTGEGFRLPEIVNVLKPAILLEGQPARLDATIDGEPQPEIKWLRDGDLITADDRIKIIQSPDGTVALEIGNVTPADAGRYTLMLSNIGGETRCSAPVEVNRPPIFVHPLKDTAAVEGLPSKLECKITGDPVPEIKWLKDGQELPTADNHIKPIHLADDTAALVFDKCIPQDSGHYSISAKNPHGTKSSESDFKIIGKEVEGQPQAAPAFVTPLSKLSVPEGDSFKLEATVSGNPLPTVTWYLDDQLVPVTDKMVPTFDGKKVALSVRQCNINQEGTYVCRLVNSLGDVASQGEVTVLANKPPKFIEKLSDMKFSTDEPMTLTCRVVGIPTPDIEWYYNGNKCENGLKYDIQREDDKCIFVLGRPRSKESGVYECRAKNSVGSESCKATITISGTDTEGEPPLFLMKIRNSEVLFGMPIKFTACISGFPNPEIKWFKDGDQLRSDSRRTLEVEPAHEPRVLRLLLPNVKQSDLGTYRVSISNMFGSDTCTAKLSLQSTKEQLIAEKPQEVEKPSKAMPPPPLPHAPYIFKMTDTWISLGWRPIRPQYPQVPSTYCLEMRKVPDGNWTIYKSGIKDSSCDVRDLAPGVDYEFRVKVENKYGVSDPSPYLTAHRTKLRPPTPGDYLPKDYDILHTPLEKNAEAPRFLRKEMDQIYAVKGQPARVEFWVYGYPQPKITWCFNGGEVETGKYDFLEDRNGQVILFISRMGDDDVGSYTCKAVNEHGEAQQKIKVLIAEPPAFIQRMAPTTVMARKGGEFKCKVIGVPYPKIRWFKDWHPLSESSRINMRQEQPESCYLTLSDTILKDCGLYTCVASNVAGTTSSSAILTVEESEQDYHIYTYRKPSFSKLSERPFEDSYDIGDELGRGTQGITYHAVERSSGKSYAAKVMHGTGHLMDFMTSEVDVMSQLCHPRLLRLWNAHKTKSSLTLATDIRSDWNTQSIPKAKDSSVWFTDGSKATTGTGAGVFSQSGKLYAFFHLERYATVFQTDMWWGELLPHLLHQNVLTESLIAQYVKQILEGLQHMHEKNIAHLGLTIGDLLVTRLNSDSIKIGDFGLATKLYYGRDYIQQYGHPEFVAPEAANKQSVSLASDMWSVGIIAYILLTGDSPFLRENDRETLKEVQKGKVDFYHDGFVILSDEAKDFVTQLLQTDASKRMDVTAALRHKWLNIASLPDKCDELSNQDSLREYHKRWKSWYANASCKRYYRRRTLESCFTHPSRMIYPPGEEYTPPSTPDIELGRSDVKPSAFDDVTFQQRIEREPIDVRSESHYQNGPDTFLLPLRDPDFPVRIRRYLKVGANRSPILARHLKDKHWGYSDVAVRERRKFMDVMDEEIADEKRGLSKSAPLRLRHEVGTVGSGFGHLESKALRKKRGFRIPPGSAPFFREKLQDVVIREDEEAVFSCRVASELPAQFSWFRNDGILIDSSRIIIKSWSDGRCTLTLRPAKAYDMGVYRCAARNTHGSTNCRARLNIGSATCKPEPPKIEKCSDTEVYLSWMPPKFEGHSITIGYALEYKEIGEENWTKVASNISHEFFLVKNLKPSTTYVFRISALNRFGWSDFSNQSQAALTLAESAPKLQLSKAQKYQQEVTEGGQPLLPDEPEPLKLDYSVEEDPLELENEEPTDLCNFISEISRGQFSVVLKVWVKKANATFVAKACQITDTNSETVKQEFEIYKSLQHERIARLHSATLSSNCLFLVMERLSGIDVLTYLSSKQMYTEETVSKIIHQVIDALQYLHFRSICYFELQPDNVVMVDRHSTNIKLVDFGCAQYVPDEGAKVQVKGSFEYLAPEILKGEEVNSAADIWGVGVLTYILLSGVSPFAGESDLETKDNVLFVRYHFDHLYKEVSQEATHFIMQVFKRTPQKRPTTEECLENKWLLPNEYMIKKREHAVLPSHKIQEFSELFHSCKSRCTPSSLLTIFGKPLSKSSSLDNSLAE